MSSLHSSNSRPAQFPVGAVFHGLWTAMDTVPEAGPPKLEKGSAHHGADAANGICRISQFAVAVPKASETKRVRRHRSRAGRTRAALCIHLLTSLFESPAGPASAGVTFAGTAKLPIRGRRRPKTHRITSSGVAAAWASR